jgi:hypothetical protein
MRIRAYLQDADPGLFRGCGSGHIYRMRIRAYLQDADPGIFTGCGSGPIYRRRILAYLQDADPGLFTGRGSGPIYRIRIRNVSSLGFGMNIEYSSAFSDCAFCNVSLPWS